MLLQHRGPDQWKPRPSWCKDMPHHVKGWWQYPGIHQVAIGKILKQLPRAPTSITPQAPAQQPPNQSVNPTHNKSQESQTSWRSGWTPKAQASKQHGPWPKPKILLQLQIDLSYGIVVICYKKSQLKIANWNQKWLQWTKWPGFVNHRKPKWPQSMNNEFAKKCENLVLLLGGSYVKKPFSDCYRGLACPNQYACLHWYIVYMLTLIQYYQKISKVSRPNVDIEISIYIILYLYYIYINTYPVPCQLGSWHSSLNSHPGAKSLCKMRRNLFLCIPKPYAQGFLAKFLAVQKELRVEQKGNTYEKTSNFRGEVTLW